MEAADYKEEEVADFQEDEGEYNEQADEGIQAEDVEESVRQMEAELEELTRNQEGITDRLAAAPDRLEENSIYVGQVDYEATPEELQLHFAPCGTINRVTILCDKITGQAKGYAYIEFADKEAAEKALELDESMFKSRQLKVMPKRQNAPVMRGGRGGRGRGGRFGPVYGGRSTMRAGGRGYGRGPPAFRGGGRGRGGGRFFRGGGRGGRAFPGAYPNPYY